MNFDFFCAGVCVCTANSRRRVSHEIPTKISMYFLDTKMKMIQRYNLYNR